MVLDLKLISCGCGSVGRAVATDTRGPRIESSHWQKITNIYLTFVYCQLCIEKTKIKKKVAVNGPLFNYFFIFCNLLNNVFFHDQYQLVAKYNHCKMHQLTT